MSETIETSSEIITLTIDGQEIQAAAGQTILQAAQKNGIYIPTLCALHATKENGLESDIAPGTCRICTVKVNGRTMAACTTPVAQGFVVENDTEELNDLRKTIVELLFVEGNHFCPSCEKSGSCDLQALAYRYQMLSPRFRYAFSSREVNAESPKLLFDRNRCILCRRCVLAIRTEDGKQLFGFTKRGDKSGIIMDEELVKNISEEQAQQAMHICPVGAIIRKEKGFDTPFGQRKYDQNPIGSETVCTTCNGEKS
ncbi:MAG: 2Fe-2S iron-sulfur cluster-binding protein [Candidatus Electrothrix scaldis]|nr:MAG: 2Fe-2S iron-sulfur cluster-binding protein [Candidatus Electrothrix sp. GW3-3]